MFKDDQENSMANIDLLNNTAASGINKGNKKKGKKKKGRRASSRASSRSSNDSQGNGLAKPDYEAEEVVSTKRRQNMDMTNKSDLLKPVSSEGKKRKPIDDEAYDKTADEHAHDNHLNETKGFDTLMAGDENDDYN